MLLKYDTHVHTSETSRCGHLTAAETVRLYREAGYAGICVTDHYIQRFFDGLRGSWSEKADAFLSGYRAAKAAGGMDVILGAEIHFGDRYKSNDYLVYGMTEEIIYAYPELYRLTIPEFRRIADRHGLVVIQAHPMRDNMELVHLDLLDGVEVYNGNPNHEARNELVARMARERGFIMTSGSDCHDASHVGRGGIETVRRIENSLELAELLRRGDYSIIAPFDPMTV